MCPPRQLDGFERYGGVGASSADTLRLQLATLRWRESVDVAEHRARCEEMLERAVELRAERRLLSEQMAQWERDTLRTNEISARSNTRWGHTELELRTELAAERAELDDMKAELRGLKAGAVLEDDPEEELEEAEEHCRGLREEAREYEDAEAASAELCERLRGRAVPVRRELAQKQAELLEDELEPPTENLESLQHEVNILRARLRLEEDELGDEAERLRIQRASDRELPRLRMAERERKKAQAMLMQARWDRDVLERDFGRVISGLEEQRAAQELSARNLRTEILNTKQEGEEMVSVMRENDLRMAEMRHDQLEAEGFINHLHGQLRRLEAERSTLRSSLDQEAHDRQHVATLAVQALVEGLPDAQALEEDVPEEEKGTLEARLAAGQARNAVLRLEVAALEPALESHEASKGASD